ncbi:flavodoxin family protein [Enterococcus sp. UD-01]|jgi:multimeric flavodoxin WrbA|uniref:flavodoxin family protein n=1 Tax=Enterococcus sp. UD-01 TaxID=3373911 RepID=UPI0038339B07
MFKIFSYCGSAQNVSITNNIAKEFLFRLTNEMIVEYSIRHYKCNEIHISLVDSLNQFLIPEKAMDTDDDMFMLAQHMLESKLVLFSTPVYFKNVSAGMKILLDRIIGWTHSFELVGKYGVCIVCGSQNGSEETMKYMEDFMLRLGLGTIQFIEYNANKDTEETLNQKINISVQSIIKRVNNLLPPQPTLKQIEIYKDYQTLFQTKGINEVEYKIWQKKAKIYKNLSLEEIMNKEF